MKIGDSKASQKPKLFVDMDGTLAEWKTIEIPTQIPREAIRKRINDVLYQKDYYYNLKPNMSLVATVQKIIKEDLADVYILSCVLPDNPDYPNAHPKDDKNRWLDGFFGNTIPKDHRLFVPDGEPKLDSISKLYGIYVTENDLLLDDYTHNLMDWASHTDREGNALRGCKFLNGINDTHRSWQGKRVANEPHFQSLYFNLLKRLYQTRANQRHMPNECTVRFFAADDVGSTGEKLLSVKKTEKGYEYAIYKSDKSGDLTYLSAGSMNANEKYGIMDVASMILANYNLERISSVNHKRTTETLEMQKENPKEMVSVPLEIALKDFNDILSLDAYEAADILDIDPDSICETYYGASDIEIELSNEFEDHIADLSSRDAEFVFQKDEDKLIPLYIRVLKKDRSAFVPYSADELLSEFDKTPVMIQASYVTQSYPAHMSREDIESGRVEPASCDIEYASKEGTVDDFWTVSISDLLDFDLIKKHLDCEAQRDEEVEL